MTAPMDELTDILEAERECLLAGDLEALSRLVSQKETLYGALDPNLDLAPLKRQLSRNRRLLKAAMTGLDQARTAIRMAVEGGPGRDIYGPDGRRDTLWTRSSVQRKA